MNAPVKRPGPPRIRCIGICTGGGDASGLNAVIRAAVKTALNLRWADLLWRQGVRSGAPVTHAGRARHELGKKRALRRNSAEPWRDGETLSPRPDGVPDRRIGDAR